MTEHIVEINTGSTFDVLLNVGINGTNGVDGLSAYEIAVENGFEGTEQEWLTSLEGTNGVDGASAYQVAVNNSFVGTEQEWLDSLSGGGVTPITYTKLSSLNVGYITPVAADVHRYTTTIDGVVRVVEATFRATLPSGALYLSSAELSDILGTTITLASDYPSILWSVVAYHTDVNFDVINCMVTSNLGVGTPYLKISGRMSNTLSYYQCQADITLKYYPTGV